MSSAPSRTEHVLALVTVACAIAFWVLDGIAVLLAEDGYRVADDYVSSLAARGSSVGLLGVVLLLAFAAAHVTGGVLVLLAWRTKVAGGILLVAGVAVLVVALLRVSCPGGEAGCGLDGGPARDFTTALHGVVAGVYGILMWVALLAAGIAAIWERGGTRVVAILAWPALVVSWASLLMWQGGVAIGIYERVWLGVSALWLVLVAVPVLRSRERNGA